MCRAPGSKRKGAARVDTRTVQARRAFLLPHPGQLHGPCKRENSQHGSSTRGVSVRRATSIFRTRGVLLNTDRVRILASTGLSWFARGVFTISLLHGARFLVQHGACRLARVKPVLHGSTLDLHESCNFSSSEVGNLTFSQNSGLFMI